MHETEEHGPVEPKDGGIPAEGVGAFALLAELGERSPLTHYRPTPPALEFHKDGSRGRLFRGPNQASKTVSNVAECLWRLLGTHPHLVVRPPPVHGWIICSSWQQSLIIQRKLYELCPKDELADETRFTIKNGFTGGFVQFRNGSTLQFRTAQQDTVDLASATLDFVSFDEPPHLGIFSEVMMRISARPGAVWWCTLTPIGRPVDFLRDKVDAGELTDLRFSLTPANCTPTGSRIPFRTAKQIADAAADCLPLEREQRLHGSWEGISTDRILEGFGEHCIEEAGPTVPVFVGVGIDHGAKAGRQSLTLVYVGLVHDDEVGFARAHVWIVDEIQQTTRSTTADDAKAFLELLSRNGVGLWNGELDRVVGDRSHGGDRYGNQKSNVDLRNAIAFELGKRVDEIPQPIRRISTPRKRQGSVWYGVRLMNKLAGANRLHVHPRCKGFIHAAMHWKGDTRAPEKDRLDSARYIIERLFEDRQLWKGPDSNHLPKHGI